MSVLIDKVDDFVPEVHVLSSKGLESLDGTLVPESQEGRLRKVEDTGGVGQPE
jgi:hypothetical protein